MQLRRPEWIGGLTVTYAKMGRRRNGPLVSFETRDKGQVPGHSPSRALFVFLAFAYPNCRARGHAQRGANMAFAECVRGNATHYVCWEVGTRML